MKKLAVAVMFAACLGSLRAQGPAEIFKKHLQQSADFTIDVAKAMPADGYTFKPNDEEMDFGRVMVHIALANNNAFAILSGQENPTPKGILATYRDPKGTFKKDDVIQFLTDSFAFCTKAMETTDMERFHSMLGPENRKMTGLEWFWSYFTHTAHHRGQAEVYLRVKNIKPPAYRF